MTPEQFQRVAELFDRAKGLSADGRSALLAGEQPDTDVRAKILRMLEHHDETTRLGRLDATSPGLANPSVSPIGASQIDGYDFVRELHRGGQGVVYQAIEKATKRKVAIKVLLEGPYASDHARRRFEREIELAASLKHPNIVPVFHSGLTPDGRQFCVMDYVRGVPLQQYVREQKLGLEDALKLFAKVCEAVNYAHQKGVIHRDLKPSNILVDSDGSPKVLDFGLAKQLGGPEQTLISMTGQVVGTLPYLSPEQARGNPDEIDIRTDVYSLGVVLYEMLTGHYPYPVIGQMAEVLRHIASTEPTPPSRRWKPESGVGGRSIIRRTRQGACPIDDEVQTIVLRALTKERQRRYQSAADLAGDIEHYLKNEPIEAKRDSTLYVLGKQLRRHRGPAAIAAAFVLLLAGFTVTMTVMAKRNADLAEREQALAHSEGIAKTEAIAARDEARIATSQAVSEREKAESEAYAANVTAADASLSANEPARLRTCLDACPKSLRGWEWHWYNALSDSSLAVVHGHGRVVASTSGSGGIHIITATRDNVARVWDLERGKELAAIRGHKGWINSAVFSRDGSRIVTASADGTTQVADARTGEVLAILRGQDRNVMIGVAISPDAARVVTVSGGGTACVWNATNGKLLFMLGGHKGSVRFAAFSPAGNRIITSSPNSTARVWDTANGREVLVLHGHDSEIISGEFSACGLRILTVGSDSARVWDAATGKQLAKFVVNREQITTAAFSPDGTRVVAASDKDARVWDVESGKELAILRGHTDGVASAAFSPDGNRIVTGSWDGTARIWDAMSGKELSVLRGHVNWVISATFNSLGSRVVTCSRDGSARLWDVTDVADLAEHAVLCGHEGAVYSATFSPDSMRVVTAAGDNAARVWEVATGKLLSVMRGHKDIVTSAAFSPDGASVITTSWDNSARVWTAANGTELSVMHGPRSAAFCPDGMRVITTSLMANTARVFDTSSGNELAVFRGHEDWATSAAFSPDGTKVVTGSRDHTARVWDAASGKELTVLRGHEDVVATVTFGPDGSRIATASWDHTARLWDVTNGKELAVLKAPENLDQFTDGEVPPGFDYEAAFATFSPDGRRVITALGDRTACVWDSTSRMQLAILRGHKFSVTSATFSPDGTRIVTASFDKTARIWDSIPYRIRYAERQRRERGEKNVNLGVQYLKEVRGEAPTTWLSDPASDIDRPDLTPPNLSTATSPSLETGIRER